MTIFQIDHLTLFVSDLGRTLRFYEELLGFHIAYEGTLGTGLYGAFVDVGPTMLNLIESSDLGPLIAQQHVGFTVDDVDAVFARLLASGVTFDQSSPETLPEGYVPGQRFIEFRDPDGIRLELVERSPEYRTSHSKSFAVHPQT